MSVGETRSDLFANVLFRGDERTILSTSELK